MGLFAHFFIVLNVQWGCMCAEIYYQTGDDRDLEMSPSPSWLDWLSWWICATYAGVLMGLSCAQIGMNWISSAIGIIDNPFPLTYSDPNIISVDVFLSPTAAFLKSIIQPVIAGILFGMCMGVAQAYILRSLMARAAYWVLAMIASCTFVAVIVFRSLLQSIFWVLLLPILFGIPQWLVLRLEVPKAGWWVPISLLAIFSSLLVFKIETGFIGVCLSLLVFGLSTGIGLLWMFRGHQLRKI